MWAVACGHAHLAKLLIAAGADIAALIMRAASNGHYFCWVNELHVAAGDLDAKDGDEPTGCRMLQTPPVGSEPSRACGRETALIEAARTGHEHVVELLIAAGADAASADDDG
jgi:ankyrin repeat protein